MARTDAASAAGAATSMAGGTGADALTPNHASDKYTATLASRRQLYGPNTSLSYDKPLMIVRGHGSYLYDDEGLSYLDCVNNVSHVGHGNAEVSSAISAQLHTLNTNSRYLHPDLPTYTRMLLNTLNSSSSSDATKRHCTDSNTGISTSMGGGTSRCSNVVQSCSTSTSPQTTQRPQVAAAQSSAASPSLEVLYLVCSGSEANDLALRIISAARPEATHIAVMGGAYHGHTTSLIALSPYKFWGTGGGGRLPNVHVIPCPDPYRGENLDGRVAGRAALVAAERAGGRLGGFFCESILSCGGQVVLPPGYLQDLYGELRAAKVVLVADEVQCGFGRCGESFWGFQTQDVSPDIVTMGKPIGNGYPMAALATTRELGATFAASGMEYFNTYGGSTAAVAAGLAVLRILQRDRLQTHAQQVGGYLIAGLQRLAAGPGGDVVGDVRGLGLFLGVEVVRDRASRRHAPATARWIKERMKARRALLSTDGPYDNVIKIKPPMVFGFREADLLLRHLGEVLELELTAAVRHHLAKREEDIWSSLYGPRQQQYRENQQLMYLDLPQAKL